MASNEITFTVKVKKDGNLKVIAKDADKAAKCTEKLKDATDTTTKARNRFSKGEKGVAAAGANSTKNFSKMNQAMVGSGGLVGAYATLAANVFALTAAFGLLQRAAAATQLAEGLEYTGRAAGRNLPYIAEKLKEITGNAVSTAEAMSLVALATSSGFSGGQIAELARVAKGASLALGRDMTDALNRLIKGSAKLEPELLDELGIMVRLDDAARDYATSLGVTVESLTQYQKRQAFVTAVTRDGMTAFRGVAEAVEPNAYDQLSAALADLLRESTQFLNKALIPMAKFFTGSKTGMVAGLALFASTIRGSLLPSLSKGAQEMQVFANSLQKTARESLSTVKTTGQLPQIYTNLVGKIKDGTATTQEMTLAQKSLNDSLRKHNADLVHNSSLQDKNTAKYATKIGAIQGVTVAQTQLLAVQSAAAKAEAADAVATVMNAASKGSLIVAIKGLGLVYRTYVKEALAVAAANGVQASSFIALRAAMLVASTGVRALGIAILQWMPWLALIGIAISVAMSVWDTMFADKEKTEEIDKITESMDHLGESADQLAVTIARIKLRNPENAELQIFNASLDVAAGAAATVRDRMHELMQINLAANQEKYSKALKESIKLGNLYHTQVHLMKEGLLPKGSFPLQTRQAWKKAIKEANKYKGVITNIDVSPLLAALAAGLKGIEGKAGMEENAAAMKEQMIELTKLHSEGKATAEAVRQIFAAPESAEVTSGLLKEVTEQFNKFQEARAKVAKKVTTPFDDMHAALSKAALALTQVEKGTENITKEQQKLIDALNDPKGDLAKKIARYAKGTETAKQTIVRMSDAMKEHIDILNTTPGLIKKQKAELKALSEVRKFDLASSKAAHIIEDEILDKMEKQLNSEKALLEVANVTEAQAKRLREITSETAAIEAARRSDATKNIENVNAEVSFKKMLVAQEQKMLDISKKRVERVEKEKRAAMKLANLSDPRRGRKYELNAADELQIQKEMIDVKWQAAIDEYLISVQRIEMEYALLRAQAGLLKEKAEGDTDLIAKVEAYEALLKTVEEESIRGLGESLVSTVKTIRDTAPNKAAVRSEILSAGGDSPYEVLQNQDAAAGTPGVDAGLGKDKEGNTILSDKIATIAAVMKPMEENLKKLGPEGELVAAVSHGGLVIAESYSAVLDTFDKFEEGEGKLQKGAAIASAIASTIGQIAQIQAAASAARVAGIDKEIAAEKKRDGKSKASMAKIRQLEKKKEAEKRKAFETNKKMLMAQTVANTAAGIMSAIAREGALGIAMAILIGVMGAAQLAIISGTSYEGGGASSAGTGPTQISVGERGKSSDLSKSQSARGELAYFRGEQGMGGAENFRSAFYGAKHRASGGNAGYVVGEQGPELFMPDRPGTIVPSDDVSDVGGATNVTFSINAIDAAGVEDVLMEQQGNIIGMLRQAANSYGEDFMEDLDESTYTTPVARRA